MTDKNNELPLSIPSGSVSFNLSYRAALSPDRESTLWEKIVGAHFFRISCRNKTLLIFYHSSPGTGTRNAVINLSELPDCEELEIILSWSPLDMGFSARPHLPNPTLIKSMGEKSNVRFVVGLDGGIMTIDGSMTGVRFTMGGKELFGPSAIEAWHETEAAIDILFREKSTPDFQLEAVKTNMSIVMLVTGLEAYCKKRFQELAEEGIVPRIEALSSEFLADSARNTGLEKIAGEENLSPLQFLAKKINFQDLEKCKKAYNKGYGIRFGEVPAISKNLAEIRRFLKYRHKIIHVSSISVMLAKPGDADNSDEAVFSNEELAKKAKEVLHNFVQALHAETLKIGYMRAV